MTLLSAKKLLFINQEKEKIMKLSNYRSLMALITTSILALGGCNSSVENTTENTAKGMDISMFVKGAFTQAPKIVDCETTEGTATRCYQLLTSGGPAGRAPGPFCPRTITDGADVSGGWFSKDGSGDLVDLTGNFILKLSEYYGDEQWVLYDAKTKKVRYTATVEACAGAAHLMLKNSINKTV